MNYKKGDKTKFSFSKNETITDIKDVDFEWINESVFCTCPNCGKKIKKTQIFNIRKLIVIENGKHYIGISDNEYILKIDKKDIPEKDK